MWCPVEDLVEHDVARQAYWNECTVFKDGGKEEKRKEENRPTSSSVKCYFVRTESSWAVDVDNPYILANKSIHEARSIFMHVHTTPSLAKYMMRFSLILSKTIKLDVDLASVHIEEIEDIPCMDENGAIVYNADGEKMIHTDGTGFISEDLAKECPGSIFKGQIQIRGSEHPEILPTFRKSGVPLLIQFRLFNNGLAAKGTVLVDKRLPSKTIYIRPSMIKVYPDRDLSDIQCCNSFEIVATSENGQMSGSVLVYKSPGLHFGDIHILKATYIKDMEKNIVGNSKYAIFFPTKGPRSLADEMANSDFDGDMYWVSWNPQLLEHFRASEPWPQPTSKSKISLPKPDEFCHRDLEKELFQQFLVKRFESSNVIGIAADSWMNYMDRLLTLGDECIEEKQCLQGKMIELVNIYYDALDAAKTGLKVNIPGELKPEKYPCFMEKENFPSYRSTSILGLLYEKADSYQSNAISSNEIWILPCFTTAARPSCMELWEPRYRTYRQTMSHAMTMDKEFKDPVANKIIQEYVQMLYGGIDFEERTRSREEIFDEALAIYQITYNYAKETRDVRKCSFAWRVAGQALCIMYAREQGQPTSILCSGAVLRDILG